MLSNCFKKTIIKATEILCTQPFILFVLNVYIYILVLFVVEKGDALSLVLLQNAKCYALGKGS